MKVFNIKKFLPGFISIVIIAGMAVGTFATNIDLEAFIDKDTYMSKFYELDWRIDEIDNKLESLYRFTCTNVKSWYGSVKSNSTNSYIYSRFTGGHIFYGASSSSYYDWNNETTASLNQAKWIRVGKPIMISTGQLDPPTASQQYLNFEKEYPASVVKWRDGIVLNPNTKIIMNWQHKQVSPNSSVNTRLTVTMGPFKKFPEITGSGSSVSGGYICELPHGLSPWSIAMDSQNINYNYGTETMPTSWRGGNNKINLTTIWKGSGSGSSKYDRADATTVTNMSQFRDWELQGFSTVINQTGALASNLSTYTNVWIQAFYTTTSAIQGVQAMDVSLWKLTNWNVKK